jgi:hypothetical protein
MVGISIDVLIFATLFIVSCVFAVLLEVIDRWNGFVSRKPHVAVVAGTGMTLLALSFVPRLEWWHLWTAFALSGAPTFLRSEINEHRRELRNEEHVGR